MVISYNNSRKLIQQLRVQGSWAGRSTSENVLGCSVAESWLTLQTHGLQPARLPCPSPSPEVCSNSCLLSQWHHPTISSSFDPFSSIFLSIRVFFSESVLCISWPKFWSFSFSTSPSNVYSGLISFRIDWFDLLIVQGTFNLSSNTIQKHQFFRAQFLYVPTFTSIKLMMPFTISSSDVPFSSHLQPSPASGSFSVSQFFASGGQSIGVSASASILPMNIQDWFPSGWTGWISLQSKGLSRVFSNTTVQKHQFFDAQVSLQSSSYIHTWLLEKQ